MSSYLINLASLLNMHLMLPKSRAIFVFPIFWIIQKVLAKQDKKLNKSFSARYFKVVKCFVHKIGSQRFAAWRSGGLEVRMFKFSTMFIRIPNVQFSTEAPILPNPCYLLAFFGSSVPLKFITISKSNYLRFVIVVACIVKTLSVYFFFDNHCV
jgi:hypothetical protein